MSPVSRGRKLKKKARPRRKREVSKKTEIVSILDFLDDSERELLKKMEKENKDG